MDKTNKFENIEKIFINSKDGYKLDVHIFEVKEAKAVVQIIHGMEEHQERYETFIKFLNQNGLTVVSSDMRGHGKNAKDLGFFKENKGYVELIEDQKTITEFIKKRFQNLPVYIFAHSMGTIITRVLLQENSQNYSKIVLSGYPNYQIGAYFGILLTNIIKAFRGAKYKSKLVESLSVGSFNKKIKNAKTKSDWVCHNEETIKEYAKDPYCGIGFTCSAYNDLFHLVIMMHNYKRYNNVNKELELLLLRGMDDICVGGDTGAKDSRDVLLKAGFSKMKFIDYPNMRHEILAEKDNQKVYKDIIEFYEKN